MTTLQAPGGAVSLPTPTRAALILSAKSWMRMAYEGTEETLADLHSIVSSDSQRNTVRRTLAQLERVEKALVELEGLEE